MITRFSSKIFSAILFIGFAAFSASASTYTVTNTKDNGAGSLREAALFVRGHINDTINFNIAATDPNCTGGVCTITLTSGEILLDAEGATSQVTITNQSGAKNLVISSNFSSRIFYVRMQGGYAGVLINGITIKKGIGAGATNQNSTGLGGGVYVETLPGPGELPRLTISNTIFDNNSTGLGGGIYNSFSLVSIVNSTFTNNVAQYNGGGICNEGNSVSIVNSTISGNLGVESGGGIYNYNGIANLINSTVAGNRTNSSSSAASGGIDNYNDSRTKTSVRNTIVADNFALEGTNKTFRDIIHGSADTFISLGNNLIGSSGNTGTSVAWKSSDVLDQSSGLAPLGDNGGTTPTQALLANSRALNAGTNCVLTANGCGDSNAAVTTDQRGSTRKSGAAVDIGAFEFQVGKNQFDFDADYKTDFSVYRPSNNFWYLSQTTSGFSAVGLGQSGDKLAPADFDGDGKTDLAVYRPSSGDWLIRRSSDGQTYTVSFGAAEDIPVPADFDGDGKADINLFRPSNGVWYRLNSSTGAFVANGWGISGDKPAIGDFDGDGKADLAVYRPSNGVWYIVNSSTNQYTITGFGAAEDLIVPADYDGDGRTDIAVFRPSTSTWYRLNSSTGAFAAVSWGASGDKPVPADYDGDGKADTAVYRNGVWYIINSSNSQIGYGNFGDSTDIPLPNVYVR